MPAGSGVVIHRVKLVVFELRLRANFKSRSYLVSIGVLHRRYSRGGIAYLVRGVGADSRPMFTLRHFPRSSSVGEIDGREGLKKRVIIQRNSLTRSDVNRK